MNAAAIAKQAVKSGRVRARHGKGLLKKYKDRFVVVAQGTMLLFTNEKDAEPQDIIVLASYAVLRNNNKGKAQLTLTHQNGKSVWYFDLKDHVERELWINAINVALGNPEASPASGTQSPPPEIVEPEEEDGAETGAAELSPEEEAAAQAQGRAVIKRLSQMAEENGDMNWENGGGAGAPGPAERARSGSTLTGMTEEPEEEPEARPSSRVQSGKYKPVATSTAPPATTTTTSSPTQSREPSTGNDNVQVEPRVQSARLPPTVITATDEKRSQSGRFPATDPSTTDAPSTPSTPKKAPPAPPPRRDSVAGPPPPMMRRESVSSGNPLPPLPALPPLPSYAPTNDLDTLTQQPGRPNPFSPSQTPMGMSRSSSTDNLAEGEQGATSPTPAARELPATPNTLTRASRSYTVLSPQEELASPQLRKSPSEKRLTDSGKPVKPGRPSDPPALKNLENARRSQVAGSAPPAYDPQADSSPAAAPMAFPNPVPTPAKKGDPAPAPMAFPNPVPTPVKKTDPAPAAAPMAFPNPVPSPAKKVPPPVPTTRPGRSLSLAMASPPDVPKRSYDQVPSPAPEPAGTKKEPPPKPANGPPNKQRSLSMAAPDPTLILAFTEASYSAGNGDPTVKTGRSKSIAMPEAPRKSYMDGGFGGDAAKPKASWNTPVVSAEKEEAPRRSITDTRMRRGIPSASSPAQMDESNTRASVTEEAGGGIGVRQAPEARGRQRAESISWNRTPPNIPRDIDGSSEGGGSTRSSIDNDGGDAASRYSAYANANQGGDPALAHYGVKQQQTEEPAASLRPAPGPSKNRNQLEFIDHSDVDMTVDVPLLVLRCTVWLEEKGLREEGVFRVPSDINATKALLNRFANGEDVDLDNVADPLLIAGLLKLWFRTYTESHVPPSSNKRLQDIARIEDTDELYDTYADCINGFKPGVINILRLTLGLFKRVIDNAKVNKMTLPNLCKVFGPTMFAKMNVDGAAGVLGQWIRGYDRIFFPPPTNTVF